MTRSRSGRLLVTIVMALFAGSGCDLLTSRDPAIRFGGGSGCDGDRPDSESFLAEVERWVEIDMVPIEVLTDAGRGGFHTVTARFPVFPISPGGERGVLADQRLAVHSTMIPGLAWAIEEGGRAFLAMGSSGRGREQAFYALAVLPNGPPFFAGDCAYVFFTQYLQERLGDRYDRLMRELPGTVGPRVLHVLGLTSEEPSPPGPSILAPGDTDPDLLRRLQRATMSVQVPPGWAGPYTICTRIPEGWNECLNLSSGQPLPAELGVYIGDDRILEVWLLDEHADLRSPLQRLADLDVSEAAVGPITDDTILRIDLEGELTGGDPPVANAAASVRAEER